MSYENTQLQYAIDCNCIDKQDRIKILDIQEKERQRIARDLHDYSMQSLTHLIHKLELCSMEMDDDVVQAKLELASIRMDLKKVIEDIRETIFDLRPMPFDDLGVQDVFSELKRKLVSISDMQIDFEIGDISSSDSIVLMTVFRIVRECSLNSIKHSKGKNLFVSLREINHDIEIVVEDDGKGFDLSQAESKDNHYGLHILKERVTLVCGKLSIVSNEKGTKIKVMIPLSEKK